MLNASVKELENQVFTFHSIVAPAENCGSYCCQRWQLVCESSLYQFKTKKSFLIPIRGLLNLGIVQMGTTKVKALDPKAEVAKWMIIYLKSTDGKGVSLPMSFYVVSVKDRIKKALGTLCTLRTATKRSLMRLRRLERQILKRIWVLSTKIMTLCSHYMLEKDLLATPLRKQLKT
jgi:hypothetical protein